MHVTRPRELLRASQMTERQEAEGGGLIPPFTVTVRFLGLPIREVIIITHGGATIKYSMCSPKHFPPRQPLPWACAMPLSVSELERLQVRDLQGLPMCWAFLVLGCVLSSSPGPWALLCFPFLVNCPSLFSLYGMGKRSFQLPLFLPSE